MAQPSGAIWVSVSYPEDMHTCVVEEPGIQPPTWSVSGNPALQSTHSITWPPDLHTGEVKHSGLYCSLGVHHTYTHPLVKNMVKDDSSYLYVIVVLADIV